MKFELGANYPRYLGRAAYTTSGLMEGGGGGVGSGGGLVYIALWPEG